MKEKKPYYSTEEVAEYYDVSPDLIRRLCNQGKIPGATRIGRLWRIPAEFLDKNKSIDTNESDESSEPKD